MLNAEDAMGLQEDLARIRNAAPPAQAHRLWEDAGATWARIRAGNVGVADIGRGLLVSVWAVGLLWFLLWMLTDGLVPHGLYGLGLGVVGVLAGVVGDSIKRKRER